MADERDSSARLVEAAPEATGAARHEIVLGATKAAPALLDVGKLLATRLLIQAGSGGGKSWLLRRLLEQSHGMVRQIVFDPEGELVTLAEQLDYTVCAPDNDIAPIRPGGGAAAARVIYESRRPAIVSLSEFLVAPPVWSCPRSNCAKPWSCLLCSAARRARRINSSGRGGPFTGSWRIASRRRRASLPPTPALRRSRTRERDDVVSG